VQAALGILGQELRDDIPLPKFFPIVPAKPLSVFLANDIKNAAVGLVEVISEALKSGPTAFLKSTLFDMLGSNERKYLMVNRSPDNYKKLIASLPKPAVLKIERKTWMPKEGEPYEHDWYFGYLQVAGFNTTNLRRVVLDGVPPGARTLRLEDLQKKMPITDDIFRDVSGDENATLRDATKNNHLYVCDYAELEGAKASSHHREQRYLAAPIALFYWNEKKDLPGYPDTGYGDGRSGALQPIAIQLQQTPGSGIFTPKSDPNSWTIAKYVVNMACVMQHESVAHFGDCHLIIEPIVIATHRQLAEKHPLFKLLQPHFRFTISINTGARHNLLVPGGVIATNVGTDIASTLQLVVKARKEWKWDANNPDYAFGLRGVSADALPSFPFRDDTLPIWRAIQQFVSGYLSVYYSSDQDVTNDTELQAWIKELISTEGAGLTGFGRLHGPPDAPLNSLAYLSQIVAQIIYIAGPQHAAVNYAQYPLGGFAPSAAGTMYAEAPASDGKVADCSDFYPPLDVALYALSFIYLLSSVQYDRLGTYETDPRLPYFTDSRVQEHVEDFQDALAKIEREIHKRNRTRPMPYPYQLPSQIPNSISI
jgi:arachidonate 15-lipoxygenase